MSSIPYVEYINVERSLRELGTDVLKLRPASCKPVYRICSVCKKEEIRKFHAVSYVGQIKCLQCSNEINARTNIEKRSESFKYWLSKHTHPRVGAKVTPENRAKMTEGNRNRIRSKEERQISSERVLGEKNPFYGKTHTEETRKKMSIRRKYDAKRGSECNLYGKTFYAKSVSYTDKRGRVFRLKSSWEVKVANYLDSRNLDWDYEKRPFPVTYVYEGETKNGTYIPDFFVGDEIWEVKGYWRKNSFAKWQAFAKAYPDIKIRLLDKAALKILGIRGI